MNYMLQNQLQTAIEKRNEDSNEVDKKYMQGTITRLEQLKNLVDIEQTFCETCGALVIAYQ